jgi:hypothetical protein
MKTKILYLILLLALSSCGFVINDEIIPNYYMTAPDISEQLSLSYHNSTDGGNYATIVKETVFAVGYNHHYIITKQHPHKLSDTLNRSITNYYILPLDTPIDWHNMYPLIGPLTLEQFENKKKELNITDIEFTKVYHDLE